MKYGICPISIAPLRAEPRDTSELVSQVLYGEHFKLIETRKKWSKIRLAHDKYEGWLDNKQLIEIESDQYHEIDRAEKQYCRDLISHVTHANRTLSILTVGAQVSTAPF